jgi:hypothetical protein
MVQVLFELVRSIAISAVICFIFWVNYRFLKESFRVLALLKKQLQDLNESEMVCKTMHKKHHATHILTRFNGERSENTFCYLCGRTHRRVLDV